MSVFRSCLILIQSNYSAVLIYVRVKEVKIQYLIINCVSVLGCLGGRGRNAFKKLFLRNSIFILLH